MALAEIYAKAGDMDAAVETAQSIELENERNWALAAVVRSRAGAGHLEDALRVANSLPADQRQAGLKAVAEGLRARDRAE